MSISLLVQVENRDANTMPMAAAAVGCPTGCDKCQLDQNSVITCKTTGCSGGYFYAVNGQCVGMLPRRVCVYYIEAYCFIATMILLSK